MNIRSETGCGGKCDHQVFADTWVTPDKMHLSVRLEKATGICFLLFSYFSLLSSPDWGLVFEQAAAAIIFRKSWSLSREVRVKRFSSTAWPFMSGHLWTAWSERRAQLSFCFGHSVQPKCLRHKQNGGDGLDAGFYFDHLALGTVLFEIMQPWCSQYWFWMMRAVKLGEMQI